MADDEAGGGGGPKLCTHGHSQFPMPNIEDLKIMAESLKGKVSELKSLQQEGQTKTTKKPGTKGKHGGPATAGGGTRQVAQVINPKVAMGLQASASPPPPPPPPSKCGSEDDDHTSCGCDGRMKMRPFSLNEMIGAAPILQLKIEIKLHHPIWRRVLIPISATFHDLHLTIQKCFQWKDTNLYQFQKGKENIRLMRTDVDKDSYPVDTIWNTLHPFRGSTLESKDNLLYFRLQEVGDRIRYMYDFADRWEHVILVEDVLETPSVEKLSVHNFTYPICIAGERKGPPQGCGGEEGYRLLCQGYRKVCEDRTPAEKRKVQWAKHEVGYTSPDRFEPRDVRFFRTPESIGMPASLFKRKNDICSLCFKEELGDEQYLKKCARCKKIKYCDKVCQSYDWKFHKFFCKKKD